MDIRFESALNIYQKKVESLLLKKEACNNLILGILDQLEQNGPTYKNGHYLGLVEVNGKAVYAFMKTPQKNWILADVDNIDISVVRQVAKFIHESGIDIPGVLGPPDNTEIFINECHRFTDTKSTVHMEQLIYQLDQMNSIPVAEGCLIVATSKNHILVKTWLKQFGAEANEEISDDYADRTARKYIENASFYLWVKNSKPVSMVNHSRKTKNGATINAVYTPDEHKRNGYATTAVAKLTEKLLQEGFKFCSLYTDLANPASNSIYKKIGYYKVGTSVVYQFENKKQRG